MTWWSRLFRRAALEEQLEKELSFHLEQHAADLVARGHTPDEARRIARLALGGPELVKEECRDARGTRWPEDFVQDIRYALRSLRQHPGFASIALLTLALGAGAATVMFSLIDGVLLKPYPYRDPARLLRLQEKTDWSTPFGNLWGFTYPNYLDCKRESRSLEMAVWTIDRGTLSSPGAPEYVTGAEISATMLPLLGAHVGLGRALLPEDDHPGAAPVAIVSHSLWQNHFAASSSVIGSHIFFDGKPYTIVGVMPEGFRLDDNEFDLLTPIGQNTSNRMQNRNAHGFGVWGRLRPGATLSQARAELDLTGRHLAEQYPESNKGRTFIAGPLRPDAGDARSTLWLLLAAVTLVLLVACANVASLLLARAVSREREIAMRVALGAGRGRLARQCLTESAVLALAGGALGLVLAAICIRPFAALWPGGLPRAYDVQIDWRVLLFATAVSVASGLLFGMAPALRAPVQDLERVLRAGARNIAGASRRLHSAFVIGEVAIALVLLVSAGMLGRTLLRMSSRDPGVNIHNVVTARTALSPATLTSPDRTRAAWQMILDKAHAIPGVEAIAVIDTVPMREGSNPVYYSVTAATPPEGKRPMVLANCTTPDYLKVTGIALHRGRFFAASDRKGASSVAVIDDVMAQQAFPGEDPIGRHLWIIGIAPDPVTVIGVVGHVRQWGLAADDEAPVRAQLYYPFAQLPDPLVRRWSELMSIAVKTSIDPLSIVEPLRHEVRGAAGDQVIYQVRTFEQLATASLARQRFLLLLFSVFAGFALLLACVGIYGVLAYLTSQRAPEMGLRMALGATARKVMWLVIRQSLTMIAAGTAAGTCAAIAASRALTHLVEGMQSTEPLSYALMIPLLMLAALCATFLPARRASRVDPMKALRQD